MNWKRIVGGGLVAGVVILIGEFGVEPMMGPVIENFLKRLGLSQPGAPAQLMLASAMVSHGIATVWLYAVLLSRHESGVRTASLAGFAVWALSCLLPNVMMYAFGVYESGLFWFANGWSLVQSIVAAIAGAKIYGEQRDSTVVTSRQARASAV